MATRLTPTERAEIKRVYAETGSQRTTAARVGRAQSTVCEALREPLQMGDPPRDSSPARRLEVGDFLDTNPSPFNVPGIKVAKRDKKKILTGLLYGDTHYNDQCDETLSIVAGVGKDLGPDIVCHMGDLLDLYALMGFTKNPYRPYKLQDEIDAGRRHLGAMRELFPTAEFYLLEGNHEDRLRRTIWEMKGAEAAMAQLDVFKQAMLWPNLLRTADIDIQWISKRDQTSTEIFPKWLLKHGTVVRNKSAYTARGEWEKYGMSGASGHTHRLGVYFHQDHNGDHCWVETGCTRTLDTFEPDRDPNWQRGCVVVTFDQETGAFGVEPVYYRDGIAIFRGNIYRP